MIDRLRELASKFCSRRCDYASVRIGWIPSRRGFVFSRVAALVQQPSQDWIRIALARTAYESKRYLINFESKAVPSSTISIVERSDFYISQVTTLLEEH